MFGIFRDKSNDKCGINWSDVSRRKLAALDVNQVDDHFSKKPLYWAAGESDDLWVFETLIGMGADVNDEDTICWLITRDMTDVVSLFIENSASMSVSLLSHVASHKMFRLLIESGAADKLSPSEADEVLEEVIENLTLPNHTGNCDDILEIAKELIAFGANLNNPSPLLCIELNQFGEKRITATLVSQLLELGACVNYKSDYGLTPLNYAAFYCEPDIVNLLLQHGANPNGNGELLSAISASNFDAIRLIIDAGANINQSDPDLTHIVYHNLNFQKSATPLHAAAWSASPDLVTTLLSLGADVNALTEGHYDEEKHRSVLFLHDQTPLDNALLALEELEELEGLDEEHAMANKMQNKVVELLKSAGGKSHIARTIHTRELE